MNLPIHAVPFLQPGRLVHVTDGTQDWGWGAIVNFHKKKNVDKAAAESSDYIVDILLNCSTTNTKVPTPAQDGKGAYQVVPVLLSLFNRISSLRIFIPSDLRSAENRNSVGMSIREVSIGLFVLCLVWQELIVVIRLCVDSLLESLCWIQWKICTSMMRRL